MGEASRIEVLDQPYVDTGNTCDFSKTLSSYTGMCGIQDATYGGPDAIYEVHLHNDASTSNSVSFHLDVLDPGSDTDLVLALVETCGDGTTCLASSPDFIGPKSEDIPAQRYADGVYYLYVDSATTDSPGTCGAYRLTVRGINPVPSLQASLAASPRTAVAGTPLTYHLTVGNTGDLDATEVHADLALPPGTTFVSGVSGEGECSSGDGRTVRCTIPRLAKNAGPVRFDVPVRVSPAARKPLNAGLVVRAAEGPPAEASLRTPVMVWTDLAAALEDAGSPVVAGTNLLYRATVSNGGPSDSIGGEVVDDLPGKLTFVRSESGCTAEGRHVRCPFGRLAKGGRTTLAFVVRVASSAIQPFSNRVTAVAADFDPNSANDRSDELVTPVQRKTDLSVAVSTEPRQVVAGRTFDYLLTVTNDGPSDSSGATVTDDLARKVTFVEPGADGGTACHGKDGGVTCDLGPIPADPGDNTRTARFTVKVDPSRMAEIPNRATVKANEPDPRPHDNQSERIFTTVDIEAALEVCNSAPRGVFRGAQALYRITISNPDGPSDWPREAADVTLDLSEGLTPVSSPDGSCRIESGAVHCQLLGIPAGGARGRQVQLVAAVDPDAGGPDTQGQTVFTKASIEVTRDGATVLGDSQARQCPDDGDSSSETATSTVLAGPDLVLPFFEAARDPNGPAALFTVENLTTDQITPRYDYFAADGTPLGYEEGADLDGSALRTIDLGNALAVSSVAPATATGYVWITRTDGGDSPRDPAMPASGLSGDWVQLDPFAAAATGGALVDPGAVRDSPELCRHWGVRFARAGAFDDTDFVFWLRDVPDPEDPAPAEQGRQRPPISGTLYDDAGVASVEGLTIATSDNAFRRSYSELASGGSGASGSQPAPTLPDSGVIEWTLPVGTVGNVFAVLHTAEVPDTVRVQIPGVCLDRQLARVKPGRPGLPGRTVPLVLPYYQITPRTGRTTLLFVRNEDPEATDPEVPVDLSYFEASGDGPILVERCSLAPRALWSVDVGSPTAGAWPGCEVRAGDPSALPEAGYLEVQAADPESAPADFSLSGDFVRIGPGAREGAGGGLVEAEEGPSPRKLCHRWLTHFFDEPGHYGTTFVLFVPEPGDSAQEILGIVYDKLGNRVRPVDLPHDKVAFELASADFDLPRGVTSGTVVWELEGAPGNVSAIFHTMDGASVLVPGVCLDGNEAVTSTRP